jgi:hypothetical protein
LVGFEELLVPESSNQSKGDLGGVLLRKKVKKDFFQESETSLQIQWRPFCKEEKNTGRTAFGSGGDGETLW